MNKLSVIIAIGLAQTGAMAAHAPREAADRQALQQTSIAIRTAFADGNVKAIMAYHYPQVEKSFGPDSRVVGKAAVEDDVANTLKVFRLNFVENNVESLAIRGDTAIEVTRFLIQGTPRGEGKPFTFRGRTQVVYVRYAASPTGWAVFRELIQPAT
ncbi:YybH family protein [Sphingomonas azotifigens]|uniref:YybH family protein n=1 Tax=Sphingomonas azotifigens TaxID=330920 RepID=UPI00111C796F|nr:nuclear transport factor 2 family protein [Sphingomonas azotifigens]